MGRCPLRPARPRVRAGRGGDALPRPGRTRDQAPPPGAAFLLDDERLAPVFALAAERRVPILIHGGRGLPPIAEDSARSWSVPRGAADHRPRRASPTWPRSRRRSPGGRASSSTPPSGARSTCWTSSAACLAGAGRSTPPTTPYGQQPGSLLLALVARPARRPRPTTSSATSSAGRRPASPTASRRASRRAPAGPALEQPLTFARIHHYLSMATPLLWTRQADTIGVLGLALNACASGTAHRRSVSGSPSSSTRRAISGGRSPRRRTRPRRAFSPARRSVCIHIADILTLTVGAA